MFDFNKDPFLNDNEVYSGDVESDLSLNHDKYLYETDKGNDFEKFTFITLIFCLPVIYEPWPSLFCSTIFRTSWASSA